MAAKSAQPRATYEDVVRAPERVVAEVVGGVLHTHPRPRLRHARSATRLGAELDGPFDQGRGGPGGWLILDEPEVHLGPDPDIVVPDLAGWRRERMPLMPDEAFATLAPDWVCEVLSPSTAAFDRGDKLPIYAREAVQHAWLVDPVLETLEVLRLDGGTWRIVGTWRADAVVRPEPFEALELGLASLWAR